jgi:septal ring factor EnvC (AmiA/AmiB activator)
MRRAALCLALALAAPATAQEAGPADVAAQAAADLAEAAVALDEATRARDRVAALTDTVRAYESGLSALREGLRQGALRERAIRADFDAEAERLSRLFGVLLSMQTSPEALLLLHPAGATETVRAGMLIADLTPALRGEVEDLRARLEELRQLQALQTDAAETLETGLRGMQAARTALSQAMADRTDLPRRVAEDPRAMQALINGAETLDAFASGLAEMAIAPEGEGLGSFSDARGLLPLPVEGLVIRGFDEADAAGIRRPGLLVATRPRALVASPWPATIRYAGPLLDYGNVIILEPQNGYLLVLAGLDEVYVGAGEVVDAAAPVGMMGGEQPDAEAILAETAGGGGQRRSETLYIELRIDQEPQDPATWFLANSEMGRMQ